VRSKWNQGHRGAIHAKAGIDEAGGNGFVKSILAAIPQRAFDEMFTRQGAGPGREYKIDIRSRPSGLKPRSHEPIPEGLELGSCCKITKNASYPGIGHRGQALYAARAEQTLLHAEPACSKAQRHLTYAAVTAVPGHAPRYHVPVPLSRDKSCRVRYLSAMIKLG